MIPRIVDWLRFLLCIGGVLGAGSLQAEVRLAGLFCDNMVLQQGMRAPIWGWADAGEAIEISIGGKRVATECADGEWRARLPKLKVGGPYQLVVEGSNLILLTNVLVGEVWICSGQSNMEWPLSRSFESQEDMASSANAQIRLFSVPRLKADRPLPDVEARWVLCDPDTVPGFSAVAYYFGRALQRDLNVPVGLIKTAWGGSPAEVWMKEEILESNVDHRLDILASYPPKEKKYLRQLAEWEKKADLLKAEGKKPSSPPRAPWKPCELYNGMLAPLVPYGIRGVIWYQGEANAGRAYQYRTLYQDLIRNWREDWDQGKFPFLAVQLAPWDKRRERDPAQIASEIGESDWAELREAQVLATEELPNVGIAVITDMGDKDDIHPTLKEPVGERLALAARRIAYGERKLVHSGPSYDKMKVKKDQVILKFDNIGGGLEARGGALRGFTICGPDRKFAWAMAEIEGDTVVVQSPMVLEPVAVRYGWSDYPIVNLYNREGLPASPFRTDDFPMITSPRE